MGNCAVHAYNQECKKLYIAQAFSESFKKMVRKLLVIVTMTLTNICSVDIMIMGVEPGAIDSG